MLSITEFCKKLNRSFKLWPKQKNILKTFYSGEYRELVAILGRRSGKNCLAAIISLYEVYRLLQTGNPYKHYNLATGNPIYIMSISVSLDQARIFFTELKCILSSCDILTADSITAGKIYFKTDGGSICIMVASVKSEDILGKTIFALILNEASSFKKPERIYAALGPGTSVFRSNKEDTLDSHIITLSSAGYASGIVYDLVRNEYEGKLVFCLPTWEVNPLYSEKKLRKENCYMTDESFNCEFGSVFIDSENQTVSLRIPGSQIETLKRIARLKSYEEDTDITYVSLIRECIDGYINNVMKTV